MKNPECDLSHQEIKSAQDHTQIGDKWTQKLEDYDAKYAIDDELKATASQIKEPIREGYSMIEGMNLSEFGIREQVKETGDQEKLFVRLVVDGLERSRKGGSDFKEIRGEISIGLGPAPKTSQKISSKH